MAGFGRNGSRSSPEAIATAERHREWIELRRQGLSEAAIAERFGVTQQAVSKVLLKHVRNLPAAEAESLKREQLAQLDSMSEMAWEEHERAENGQGRLKALNMLLDVEERKAKLLGLDAADRKVVPLERPTARSIRLDPASSEVDAQILKDLQAADSIE